MIKDELIKLAQNYEVDEKLRDEIIDDILDQCKNAAKYGSYECIIGRYGIGIEKYIIAKIEYLGLKVNTLGFNEIKISWY